MTTTKKATKPTPVPVEEVAPANRYCRASRYIIELGADAPIELLAHKADISASAARYCVEAHKGVLQALREAGLLPAAPEPAEQPAEKAETKAEAVPAK